MTALKVTASPANAAILAHAQTVVAAQRMLVPLSCSLSPHPFTDPGAGWGSLASSHDGAAPSHLFITHRLNVSPETWVPTVAFVTKAGVGMAASVWPSMNVGWTLEGAAMLMLSAATWALDR